MIIERRDIIRIAAGGVCGTMLTPVPWRLLDDSAKWSQNWSWIPPVPRGERTTKESYCTLCPAGCAIRAACVANHPVRLDGALCASGVAGHTVAYHPRRILAVPKTVPVHGRIGILDMGPRRAMSTLLAQAADAFGGAYLRMPDRDEATLVALADLMGRPRGSLGLDLEHTRTLVSFGAPVLERWASPSRVLPRWRTGELRVVQIEAVESRTALAANQWITDEADALKRAKLEEPAVIVDAEGRPSIAAMNVDLGAIGREGGIVARAPLPWRRVESAAAAPHSIDTLFIDASRAHQLVEWPVVRQWLASDATIVVFAPHESGLTKKAHYVLPVAAPFELVEDVETPPYSAVASYQVSQPLHPAPVVKFTAIDHLNAMLQASGRVPPSVSAPEMIKQRQELMASYRPKVARLSVTTVNVPPSEVEAGGELLLVVARAPDRGSPLITKLYEESGLFAPEHLVRMHPETAARLGVGSKATLLIETQHGLTRRSVLPDPAIRPGFLEITETDVTELCAGRVTAAKARKG